MESHLRFFQNMEVGARIRAKQIRAERSSGVAHLACTATLPDQFDQASIGQQNQASWHAEYKEKSPFRYMGENSTFSSVGDAPDVPVSITAEELLGTWRDSKGHTVHVKYANGFEMPLAVSVSRPPRMDLHLDCHYERTDWHSGCYGWYCGGAMLDSVCSRVDRLVWRFRNDTTSIWIRLDDGAATPNFDEGAVTQFLPEVSWAKSVKSHQELDSDTTWQRLLMELGDGGSRPVVPEVEVPEVSEQTPQSSTMAAPQIGVLGRYPFSPLMGFQRDPEDTPEETYHDGACTWKCPWGAHEHQDLQDASQQMATPSAQEMQFVEFVPCVMLSSPGSPVVYVPQSMFSSGKSD